MSTEKPWVIEAPEGDRGLRSAEVAALLHCSPKTITRDAATGMFPFWWTTGGHRRFPTAWMRRYAELMRKSGKRHDEAIEIIRQEQGAEAA